MPAFPFIPRMPFFRPYYRNYYSPNIQQNNSNQTPLIYTEKDEILSKGGHKARPYNYEKKLEDTTVTPNQSSKENNNTVLFNDNDAIFDLFGIKLHFDDILLICLIFFLYNEGVKDEMLFISLILLLLS